MKPPRLLTLSAALVLIASISSANAFTLSFSDADFGTTPVFSDVTTFAFDIDISEPFAAGLYADPSISNIQYSVDGDLDVTPSGFSSFDFRLDHIFPMSPPITGAEFYALNASAVAGQTLRFEILGGADFSDGLQIDELADLGGGVVFRLDAREEGTGRYHPTFIELNSDGTGRIQNADNFGGINPSTMELVDVARGEEYITDLTFDASALTIGVPEPSRSLLTLLGLGVITLRRRRN